MGNNRKSMPLNKKAAKHTLKSCFKQSIYEAGCDEAGRGCLAGPVFAAAVILPDNFFNPLLNDSKQLSEKQRNELRILIEEEAIDWALGIVTNTEIDEINILNASYLAMHRALDALKVTPQHIIIDGNRFNAYKNIPHQCIVKGDGKYFSIAAASVLAKTYRDEYMQKLDKQYPQYLWCQNKGYPTKTHRQAIKQHGTTPHHRMTFKLFEQQYSIDFDWK